MCVCLCVCVYILEWIDVHILTTVYIYAAVTEDNQCGDGVSISCCKE